MREPNYSPGRGGVAKRRTSPQGSAVAARDRVFNAMMTMTKPVMPTLQAAFDQA